jgi:hypothetical protein
VYNVSYLRGGKKSLKIQTGNIKIKEVAWKALRLLTYKKNLYENSLESIL